VDHGVSGVPKSRVGAHNLAGKQKTVGKEVRDRGHSRGDTGPMSQQTRNKSRLYVSRGSKRVEGMKVFSERRLRVGPSALKKAKELPIRGTGHGDEVLAKAGKSPAEIFPELSGDGKRVIIT